MSESGNVDIALPSSTKADTGKAEKVTAASVKEESNGNAVESKTKSSAGNSNSDVNAQKTSPPRKSSQPRHNSEQQSPRKFSNEPQSQQSGSPPRRKFSGQRQYPQAQQPYPFNPSQPFIPFNVQFQPPLRKMSNQRQQSFPTFRNYQQPRDHNFIVPHGQLQRIPFVTGPRRGSSVSATVQPQHDQSQQQKVNRKASYQQTRYESSGSNQQQGAVGVDRNGATIRKKTSDAPGASASGRQNKLSFAGPRWNSFSENNENGSNDYDYDGAFELEEPFSDSDDDETPEEREARYRRQAKPSLLLPMPRRRIRTLSGMVPAIGYSPVWGGPTMCLNCLEFFDLPKQTSEYVQHLLDKHKIVVTDIELIVDLKRYIEYWRHRFGQQPIDKIFPLVTPKEGDQLFGKVDNYYLMSEKVKEDRQIRERLALRRLEEVLSCQQREREDRAFNRQCLFCRYHTKGNRAKLIHHLYTIHHLNLGSPDNLVFVSEYLDILDGKLKKFECIYCEKTFPDQQTLAEHMRKKLHREVNPNNNYYDRFYVINYLELGKKWLEVLAEDFEDNTTAFVDSDEEEEEESWNEWQEDAEDENDMTTVCLFCDESYEEAAKLLDHMKDTHQYDLKKVFADGHFGFYDRVKFINYIRKLSYECVCFICGTEELRSWPALRKHLANPAHLKTPIERSKWDKDEFLIPTYDNDNLLCVLEEILELDEGDFVSYVRDRLPEPKAPIDNGPVHDTIPEEHEEEKDETSSKNGHAEAEGGKGDGADVKKETEGVEKDRKENEENQSSFLVIPEDVPELAEDSALRDPEVVKQLK